MGRELERNNLSFGMWVGKQQVWLVKRRIVKC